MAVIRAEIASTPRDAQGNSQTYVTSEVLNTERGDTYASSENFKDSAIQVIDGNGWSKNVYTASDLKDDDRVRVSGVEMTVAQARSVGYAFDGEEPTAMGSSEHASFPADNEEEEAPELDLRKEGEATDGEIVALENVVLAAQMHTGLDQEATIELGTDILTGELKEDDPIWDGLQQRGVSRAAAHGAISQVVQVGQQAALRELGAADYNELSSLADASPAIKAVVVKHGLARMQGKAKNVTYKHVLALARQFARA